MFAKTMHMYMFIQVQFNMNKYVTSYLIVTFYKYMFYVFLSSPYYGQTLSSHFLVVEVQWNILKCLLKLKSGIII